MRPVKGAFWHSGKHLLTSKIDRKNREFERDSYKKKGATLAPPLY